jgi:hypothetical protein
MNKLPSVALSGALVVAGMGASVSAEARSYDRFHRDHWDPR